MVVRYALRLTVALTDSHAVAPGLAAAIQWHVCCSDVGRRVGERQDVRAGAASSGEAEMGWCLVPFGAAYGSNSRGLNSHALCLLSLSG